MTLKRVETPSPNFNDRRHPLDMLVLHYTGMEDGDSALARMCDPAAEVSAHYMVRENGEVAVLVPEGKRAWHAGRSRWQGHDDLNSRSIGLEIVNGGHDFGLPQFPEAQIQAVIELCHDVLSRWPIPCHRIIGHSDIAPDRKEDPGELFPWQRLAKEGIGIWPGEGKPSAGNLDQVLPDVGRLEGKSLTESLSRIGYDTSGDMGGPTEIIRAFQRHWLPHNLSGDADAETRKMILLVEASAFGFENTG